MHLPSNRINLRSEQYLHQSQLIPMNIFMEVHLLKPLSLKFINYSTQSPKYAQEIEHDQS